ncbi:hypothetical protein PIB30_115935, partial [Stylosanthes scabra]|nr:hypothetical protein [Stylosanthes scabra]
GKGERLGPDICPKSPGTSLSPRIRAYATPSANNQMPQWPCSDPLGKSSRKQL